MQGPLRCRARCDAGPVAMRRMCTPPGSKLASPTCHRGIKPCDRQRPAITLQSSHTPAQDLDRRREDFS